MTVTVNGVTITDHTDTKTEEELRDLAAYRSAQLGETWTPKRGNDRPLRRAELVDDEF